MKKKVKRKTVMAYFRRKSIAVFMAFLMVFPQIAAGFASPPVGDVSSVRQGAIKTGKVDMASGNLAFVENIFSLKGYKLTLKYNTEGVAKEVKKINDTHATGVVGLGWKLSKDRIVRLTHQTANTDDDDYMLNAHGKMIKLTFEYEAQDTVHFRAHENPYWKIYYLERNEQWVVQKQNGNEYIYGDGELGNTLINHDANSTENSVTWNNWIGSSVVSNNQTPLIIAWNLSAIDNMYGERVKLFYEQERENVGAGSEALEHTRAAYLTRVIGQNETSIQLEYANKGQNEYADPHIENTNPTERSNGVTPPLRDNDRDAFQERFERKYLSSVTRRSPSSAIDRVVEFEYDIIGENRQQKRVLTEIKYKNNNGSLYQPSKKYAYYAESDGVNVAETYEETNVFNSSNGALYGALKSITIPGGGTYVYRYDKKEIENSRLEFDIPFPANYSYRDVDNNQISTGWHAPQLFFMNDYVVVIHEINAFDIKRSNVGVATWVGDRWAYQDFGNFDGHFYDRYHTEDYHLKNFISTFKTSLMTSIGSNLPLVGGIMAAFNDDIQGMITTYYTVGEDLADGDVGGAIRDFFVGNFNQIRDVVEDLIDALADEFEDLDLVVGDLFGINMHALRQRDLAQKAQEYNAANPRKKYHITMQNDYFALTSTFADQNGNDYNQNVNVFELDPLAEGRWHRSAIPVMLSSKYMGINSGEHFITVFDEISDMLYTMTRHRYRKWKADVVRIPQTLTEDEKLNMSAATANVGNDVSQLFGSDSEDADFLNRLSSDKRSSISARNNFIMVATCQANGENGRIAVYHHDKNKDWNWVRPLAVDFDKTLIPTDIASSGMGPVSQGLTANSILDLKLGNSIAGLTVYDNLDTEAYSDVMGLTFGGLGVTDGSSDPINPLSTIQSDLLQDMTAMTATYGIVWNQDFTDIDVVLLHAGIGQTGMKMYVNGNVIQKVGRAYTPLIGSSSLDENGTNYAFRYDGEKFVTAKWQSDYFSSIMAPDVSTQLVEASDKTYKTPKFQQYFANREVTGTSAVVQQGSYTSSAEGDSYSSFELLNNVASNDAWSEISNASQERIPAPEFVKEAVHLATDLINLVIQIVMMLIPFAQEFAAVAKSVATIDKVVQVGSLAAMAIQPAADALIDKIMGVNHKSTSIANNYISTNGKLFARQPNGNWTELGSAFDLGDDDKLVGISNGISNGYVNYTIKRANATTDSQGRSSSLDNYVTLLKNRKIYRKIALDQYVGDDMLIVRKDSLVMTSGNNAFVAYGPANDDGYVRTNRAIYRAPKDNAEARRRKASYDDATTIRLHRLANDQVTGRLHDFVVSSVETNTGFDSTYQHYVYNTNGATYHDAHGSAIYPKVDVVPSNLADYTPGEYPFGYKSYYFFNSRNFYAARGNSEGYPSSLDLGIDEPLVSLESFDHRDINDFNSRIIQPLQGRQYLMETYNGNNERVSRKIDCHVVYAHDFFHRGSQLELDHVYQPLSSASIMEVDGVATKTVNRYTDEYRATLLRTVEHYSTSIDGTPEVHYQSKRYAFEQYPELLNQNRLHEVSLVVDSVRKGDRTYVLDATTTTYRPWTINGNQMLDVEHVYKANLATDILNPEIENYQSVAAAEVAEMDRDIADYELLLEAFETEIGNYSIANRAGIAANQVAHDSKIELNETENEVFESSHELVTVAGDLGESNQEITDQQAEVVRLKGLWDNYKQLYDDAIDDVNKKYKQWQIELLVRNSTSWFTFIVPLAGGLLTGVNSAFVNKAYDAYQRAIATRDSYKDAADTAREDYHRAQDVLLSLQSEHESVLRSVSLANHSIENTLDAFHTAVVASSEAVESSMLALQILSANKRDKTKHAHAAAANSQDFAIENHTDFISDVDHVERLLRHVVASASTYTTSNTTSLVSNNEDTSTRPDAFFGYTPNQLKFMDKAVDLDGNGSPDMAYIDGSNLRVIYSDAPSVTRTSKRFRAADNATTLSGVGLNDHFQFVKLQFANRYMFLRFNSQTSNMSLINYERNNGQGRFINDVQFNNVVNWESQWNRDGSQILAGDFDGNGVSDVITFLTNSTKLMMNIVSDANHPVLNLPVTSLNSTDYGQNRFVGDFNGDGLDDILASKYDALEVYLAQVDDSGVVSFRRANVDAGFDDKQAVPHSVARCFDVTGDGIDDIVRFRVQSFTRETGDIWMSFTDFDNDTVRFTDFSTHTTDMNLDEPGQIVAVDFDGDGLNELHTVTKSVDSDVVTMTLSLAEFQSRAVYQSVKDRVSEAITDFESIRTRHNQHKSVLGDLKDQHTTIIQKVRDMDVSAADIGNFQGDIYSWFKTHSILSRDVNTGAAITTADSRGVKSSDLYDNEGRNIIASIVDADFASNEALVTGFESYEDLSKFSVVSGASAVNVSDYNSLMQAVESHTGERALLFNLGGQSVRISPSAFSPNPELSYADSSYVVSAFVKAPSEARVWVGNDTIAYADAPEFSKANTTVDGWQYIEAVVKNADLTTNNTPSIHIENSSNVYIDDITVRPLAASFEYSVYDELNLPTAKIDANGLTKHMFYDSHHRLSTVIDDTGRIYGLNLAAFSREHSADDSFETSQPNEASKFSFIEYGELHRLGISDRYRGEFTKASDQIALNFAVDPENATQMRLSFNLKGVSINWNASNNRLEVSGANGSQISEETHTLPEDFTFAEMNDQLYVWMNGKLMGDVTTSSSIRNARFTWNLTSARIANDAIVVGNKPVFKVEFTNGIGQHLQTQRLLFAEDGRLNGTYVKAFMFDGWGHAAISTLPMSVSTADLSYKPNVIQSFDWGTGIMTGDVSTYYQGTNAVIAKRSNDYKYPYFRTYYENSPLSRVVKKTKPGQEFYEVENNATTVEYQDTESEELLRQFNLSPDKYKAKKTTNSLGHKQFDITDKMGRKVMSKKGSAVSQTIDDFNNTGYAKTTTHSPNHFAATDNSQSVNGTWFSSVHAQEDLLSFSDINQSPDRGRVELVKDQHSKLVYVKTASSAATENSVGEIKYYRYDEQERVIEQGIYNARWDKARLSTLSKSPFWYDSDVNWVKAYLYDIDKSGDALYNKGRITQTHHNDGEFHVISSFDYNIYGQITSNQLEIYNRDADLVSNSTISYEYYPSGQVKKITYPNGFELVYSFNRQGKIKGIGTPDDLDMFARYRYDQLDRLQYEYRDNGNYVASKKYDLRGRNKLTNWFQSESFDTIFSQKLDFFSGNKYYDTKISRLEYGGSMYTNIVNTYKYDDQGRLDSTITDMNVGTALESRMISSYDYDANSNVTSFVDQSGERTNIDYRPGTNQDLVNGEVAYNDDGLKVRFESPIWGVNSQIAYNRYTHKPQVFFKSSFPRINSGVWYKLSALSNTRGVLSVEVGKSTKVEVDDKLTYTDPESNDIQLFKFVPNTAGSGYFIKSRANEALNLRYTAEKGFHFTSPASDDSDLFDCFAGGLDGAIRITCLGPDRVRMIVNGQTEELEAVSTSQFNNSNGQYYRLIPVMNAVPSNDFMLFSHDAKNNRVIKIRNITDVQGSLKQDTLVYMHGNNRLPLSEYFSGISVDGDGTRSKSKTISNYIYGPEFGSIGVRVYELDVNSGNPFGEPDLDETDSDSTDADGTTGSIQPGTNEPEPVANLMDKKEDDLDDYSDDKKNDQVINKDENKEISVAFSDDKKNDQTIYSKHKKKDRVIYLDNQKKWSNKL